MGKKLLNILNLLIISGAWVSSALTYALPLSGEAAMRPPPESKGRGCCVMGYKVRIPLPFVRSTQLLKQIDGAHIFGGEGIARLGRQEKNGLLYTCRGGFVDTAHVRHVADWTAFLYAKLPHLLQTGGRLELPKEGGDTWLEVPLYPGRVTREQILAIAQRAAFDLATWHEIATWYGAKVIRFFSERVSSFSLEDGYSNLLGSYVGAEAIQSALEYEDGVRHVLADVFYSLDPVTPKHNIDAMLQVKDEWWSSHVAVPDLRVQIKRDFQIEGEIEPWLVPDGGAIGCRSQDKLTLQVPEIDESVPDGGYTLYFRPWGRRFPIKRLFGASRDSVTQHDFPVLTQAVREEMQRYLPDGFDQRPILTY